jgi:hypothetical protein
MIGTGIERSIGNLASLIASLPQDERSRFERIFDLNVTLGEVVPPPAMHPWITSYFGSVDSVRRQRIVKVTNRVTLDGALFNELRARRPQEAPSGVDDDLEAALRESLGGPFCRPFEGTPADSFGRVRGHSAVTASNVAKYDGWHGVIVFDEHDPLRFTAEQVSDYIDTAQNWARRAHDADPEACYPFFIWNCLWRSGASILHGHAQMTMTRGMHYAKVEGWRLAALRYRREHQADYFADLVAAHRALGLAVDHGTATILPSLTPFKEKETHIVVPHLNDDLKSALYTVLTAFIERLGVTSFNLALYQPPLADTPETWDGFPCVVRVLDRGDPSSKTSDVGSMELFAQSVVATDPFLVVDALRAFSADWRSPAPQNGAPSVP